MSSHVETLESRRLLTVFYVDGANASASDSNSGTTLTAPLKTIGKALSLSSNNNANSQSDTIYVRAGVYREQPNVTTGNSGVSALDRTVVSAYPSGNGYEPVYILGSDLISGTWTRDGTSNRYYLSSWTRQTSSIFVDWAPTNDVASLKQIGSYGESNRVVIGSGLADMVPGSYFHDTVASRLYVWLSDGTSPQAHTLSYAARARAIYQPGTPLAAGGYSYGNFIDFKGLKLRHSNAYDTNGQDLNCGMYTVGDQRLIDMDVQQMSGVGVILRGNSQMLNCVVNNNGANAVAAQGQGFLISGGQYNYNYWRNYTSGSNAAIKVITNTPDLWGDIVNIEVAYNAGIGVWYDTTYYNSATSRIVGNYIHDNDGAGIDLEATKNFLVANNVIVGNRQSGVFLLAAENVKIFNNTIVGNYGNAAIEFTGATRDNATNWGGGTTGLNNITVRNNIIANNFTVYELTLMNGTNALVTNNTSDNNLFYRRGDGLRFSSGGTYVGWRSTPATLADWRTLSGQDASTIVTDPLFLPGGTGALAYRLGSNSPAINIGANLAADVTTDYSGSARPSGAGLDIGAFEYASGGTGQAGPVVTNTDPTVWFDDQLPTGGVMTQPDATGNTGVNRFWNWNSTPVFSGAAALDSTALTGAHRQYFTNAANRAIGANDLLFGYVYLDPANLPSQIEFEWRDAAGSAEHRAYWGTNLLGYGTDGTASARNTGALPAAGRWVKLEVPAASVGLAGVNVTGFAFNLYGGRALLDKVGNAPNSTALLPPSNLSAVGTSSSAASVSWVDNSNNESGFVLERSTDNTFAQSVTTINLGINVNSYADTGLVANTLYYYRVRAFNAGGSSSNSNVGVAYTGVGTAMGSVFNDGNNNGVRDAGESGIAGRTVYLDLNNNGSYDGAGALVASSSTSVKILDFAGSPTTVSSTLVVSGGSTISDLNVALNIQHTYDADLVISLVSPTGTAVTLANRVGGSGRNFGTFTGSAAPFAPDIYTLFDDAASTVISSGSAPFTAGATNSLAPYRPSNPLSAFNGQNSNGTWTLQVTDAAGGDVGYVNGWKLYFNSSAEVSTTTDVNGNYVLPAPANGTYTVRQVVPTGSVASSSGAGSYATALSFGSASTGLNFGTLYTSTPTVSKSAATAPGPTSGLTTALSALGADANGEANLTYTWSVVGTPPGTASFAVNGSNAAKSTNVTFSAAGAYNLLVTITNATGRSVTSAVSVTAVAPPTVTMFHVNTGSANRSMITRLFVKFSQAVTIQPGGLTLSLYPSVNNGAPSGALPGTVTWTTGDGGISYAAAFSGANVVGGSIADGAYRVTVNASLVKDAYGQSPTTSAQFNFYRLFGDLNGNGVVNNVDYLNFQKAFNQSVGSASYNNAFDYDSNGTVNNADYLQFQKRFNKSIVLT